jgi:hypothetical protein
MKKSEMQKASDKAYAVAMKVYEELASKKKQAVQEVLFELSKRAVSA